MKDTDTKDRFNNAATVDQHKYAIMVFLKVLENLRNELTDYEAD